MMASTPYLCSRCTRALRLRQQPQLQRRLSAPAVVALPLPLSRPRHQPSRYSSTAVPAAEQAASRQSEAKITEDKNDNVTKETAEIETEKEKEQGPLSRRLEEATEEALLTGGRAGQRAVLEDAGFSAELKERLLDKVASARFHAEHATAHAEAGLSPLARGGRTGVPVPDAAAARPWTGEEETADAVLRMLDDARKPLRPELRRKPGGTNAAAAAAAAAMRSNPVDLRLRREPAVSAGHKVASARDRAAAYAGGMGMGAKDRGLSAEEREAMKKELRDRFMPGARALPNSITGLAALANERIEDAIARGQFKNIPRGKGIERDARADNPFIDTTEYIMNKMIKRQEIVPPWIEKQQELVKAAHVFRARLRNDWKRHAARMIASRGGSLEAQMRRASEHARAEEAHNPRRRDVEQIAVSTNATDDVVMVQVRQQAATQEDTPPIQGGDEGKERDSDDVAPLSRPFRDPDWEAAERAYMELAVANLNALTRSYNLMAPELAKKPYFSLERELASCFADVAPQLAGAIKERAARPGRSLVVEQGTRSVFDRFGGEGGTPARIYDSKAPHYGFREMWRDLWSKT